MAASNNNAKTENKSNKSNKSSSQNSSHVRKSSQFLNKVITKDDISLLAKSNTSQGKCQEGKNNNENNKNSSGMPMKSIILDSIPEKYVSDSETVTSTSNDSDVLFSPLYDPLHGNDFYDDENIYTIGEETKSDTYLHKFQTNQLNNCIKNNSTENDLGLDDFELLNNSTNDFWKEVDGTNEEAIFDENNKYNSPSIMENQDFANDQFQNIDPLNSGSSIEEFVSDDLLNTSFSLNHSNNDNTTNIPNGKPYDDNSHYRIKLLCYRDADGKFALKTRNVMGSNGSSANNYSTGLIKKRKINKRRKLLKKAIRRKSGVCEMISTSVKINEFML